MNLQQELEDRLNNRFEGAQISVQVQGSSALLSIVSEDFADASRVRRQQLVYGLIGDLIQSGELHAVTIQAKTPQEAAGSN